MPDSIARDIDVQFATVDVEVHYRHSVATAGATPAGPFAAGVVLPLSSAPVVVDDRVLRMVKAAVLSSTAVLLVGPPGTGKTQLLRRVLDELRQEALQGNGGALQLTNEPLWLTPDESWTTQSLVGGRSVDDAGRIRFRPGPVLRAIAEDRWVVLDEANRADLDRIFGPLMTWLTGQDVTLDRVGPNRDDAEVNLAWNVADTASGCDGEEALYAAPGGQPPDAVNYSAGTHWRLLGTYNAVDVQRVFRLGVALGRRFSRVPVPVLSANLFRTALTPYVVGLPQSVVDALVAIYTAHLLAPETALGPAFFTEIPGFLRAAHPGPFPAGGGPAAGLLVDDEKLREVLAEGYVVHVAAQLNRLTPSQLTGLGVEMQRAGVFTDVEWSWIREMQRNV